MIAIGYPSGQDGAILPARECPFCLRNNISRKSKRVYESFLSQNIFRDSKKIFCDFSVGMELENEKTETRYHSCQEPMSRSLQLLYYVTAFLQTDLFLVYLFFCQRKAVPVQ